MPYAVLVSALGAIVSTAIAMFVLHSFPATKIAPVVGAILGLIFAIATLRLRGMPWRATLEEYRTAGGGNSGGEVAKVFLNLALRTAIAVSIVELPFLFIEGIAVPYVFVTGLTAIIAYTCYRAWRSGDQRLFSIEFDAFNVAGAVALLSMSAFFYYGTFEGLQGLVLNASGLHLVKAALVYNAVAAFPAAVIAVFGLGIANFILQLTSPQRH